MESVSFLANFSRLFLRYTICVWVKVQVCVEGKKCHKGGGDVERNGGDEEEEEEEGEELGTLMLTATAAACPVVGFVSERALLERNTSTVRVSRRKNAGCIHLSIALLR